MDTSSVPLMMDIEGEEERGGPSKGVEAGLENDFAFNNNVAGASKHVRLGEAFNFYKKCHFTHSTGTAVSLCHVMYCHGSDLIL